MIKLGLIDRKLLFELDSNSRAPISTLSKKLSISRDVVSYRLNRFKDKKIINSYGAVIDASKLGYKIYRIFLKFYAMPKQKYQELLNLLKETDNIFWIGECDGFVDLAIGIWINKSSELYHFYNELVLSFRKYIKKDYVYELISFTHFTENYIGDFSTEDRVLAVIGKSEKESFDQIDIQILNLLVANSRIPIIEIASKVNLDSSTVIHRIKQLKKRKIISAFTIDINHEVLGRDWYSIKIYLSDLSRRKEIIEFLKSVNSVITMSSTIGGWDIDFDMKISSSKEYYDLMDTLKNNFSEMLEIEHFRIKKTLMTLGIPNVKLKN